MKSAMVGDELDKRCIDTIRFPRDGDAVRAPVRPRQPSFS